MGLIVFSVGLWSGQVMAVTYVVTDATDSADNFPGDGQCAAIAGGQCTLRAAIQEANLSPNNDTIFLDAEHYVLTLPGIDEDLSETGDLDITGSGDLIIEGVSRDSTIIDGNQLDRIFHIGAESGRVSIRNLTVRGGDLFGVGAGIYNSGFETELINVEVSENLARAQRMNPPTRDLHGVAGGVFNDVDASLIVDQSYIAYNNADNRGYFDEASRLNTGGGGIYNMGMLEVRNHSRIEDNHSMQGGGIGNFTGNVIVRDSVVAFNTIGFSSGGGILNWGGVLDVRRSIISSNHCFGCDGTGISNQPGGDNTGAGAVAVIVESQIENNTGGFVLGAGLSNFSHMYVGYSSVSWNSIGGGFGAGISNLGQGDLTVENTTIIGNHFDVLGLYGAGIYTGSATRLNHVTMAGNLGLGTGQELHVNTGDFDENDPAYWITIKNSIIGDPVYARELYPNLDQGISDLFDQSGNETCGGGYSLTFGDPPFDPDNPLTDDLVFNDDYLLLMHSEGNNLETNSLCGLTVQGDVNNLSPELLPAGDYGGTPLPAGPFLPHVLSRPPVPTSIVVDSVPLVDCTLSFDQYLHGRPHSGGCDKGAVELNAVPASYADLKVTASSTPSRFVSLDQSVVYKVVIRNLGKNPVSGLSGTGRPSHTVGQPVDPAVRTTFDFLNLKVTDVSFSAPQQTGVVECEIVADDGNESATCTYDQPLAVGDELIIFLTLKPVGIGWTLSSSATIDGGTPPDPVMFNNTAEIRNLVGVGNMIGTQNAPVRGDRAVSAGAFSWIELTLLSMLTLVGVGYRLHVLRSRVSRSSLFVFITLSFGTVFSTHAVVPTITSVTPQVGSAVADTVITIEGTDFHPDAKVALLNDVTVSSVVTQLPTPGHDLVSLKNNLLYLASVNSTNIGVSVYDVSDPLSPVEMIWRFLPNSLGPLRRVPGKAIPSMRINGMVVRPDNYLYLLFNGGMSVHDFNDPTQPTLVSYRRAHTRSNGLQPTQTGWSHRGRYTAIDGDMLYYLKNYFGSQTMRNQPALMVIDTTKTTGADILGYHTIYDFTDVQTKSIKIFTLPTALGPRKYVFLASDTRFHQWIAGTQQRGTMYVYDVTDPTQPLPVGVYDGPMNQNLPTSIWDMDVMLVTEGGDTKAYAVTAVQGNNFRGGLAIYDVTPDSGFLNTEPVGQHLGINDGRQVFIQGQTAILLDEDNDAIANGGSHGYWEFDVSDPVAPKIVGGPYAFTPARTNYTYQSAVSGDYIYASSGKIFKMNEPLRDIMITPTQITATVPAGYRAQVYDIIVTNPLGEAEEARLLDSFSIP